MTISVDTLTALIICATFLAGLAPITLLVLWLKDLKGRKLW